MLTQLAITCLKIAIETLEQGVKYVQDTRAMSFLLLTSMFLLSALTGKCGRRNKSSNSSFGELWFGIVLEP